MFSTSGISDAQLEAMWRACSDVSALAGAQHACRRLSERLTAILSAPTLVCQREVSPWKVVVHSQSPAVHRPDFSPPRAEELERLSPAREAVLSPVAGPGGVLWTPVPLDEGMPVQRLLLLPGNWHEGRTATWLPRFARTAALALRLAAAREALRRGEGLAAGAYEFARRLGGLADGATLHQFIVDEAARTANARLGGLSVYRQEEGVITVTATHGYPTDAVDHVRIIPGSGIIGGVFSAKRPLLVRDTTRVPGLSPRSRRYQTASFMAVPILAGSEPLGVVTLADRGDGRPFTRDDLAAVRVISVVAALALTCERLNRTAKKLAQAAAVDPLTGVFNRRYLQTRLDAELERSRRSRTSLSLMMIDADSFKRINDTLGHQTGDIVLRAVAELICRSIRASDVCTRYGGDEFAVLVAEGHESALGTAERIRSRVEAFGWESIGIPTTLPVTVSVGLCVSDAGDDAGRLIERADRSMYAAKAQGGNRVVLSSNT